LTAGTLLFALVLVVGMLNKEFRTDISKPDKARGFITFLIAIASIAMITIMFISTLWLDSAALKERFPLEKDVLTVLVGILGTIVGYYFWTATSWLATSRRRQKSGKRSECGMTRIFIWSLLLINKVRKLQFVDLSAIFLPR
jgi:Mn2+/Fe2+ NRAMP family transporter